MLIRIKMIPDTDKSRVRVVEKCDCSNELDKIASQ